MNASFQRYERPVMIAPCDSSGAYRIETRGARRSWKYPVKNVYTTLPENWLPAYP